MNYIFRFPVIVFAIWNRLLFSRDDDRFCNIRVGLLRCLAFARVLIFVPGIADVHSLISNSSMVGCPAKMCSKAWKSSMDPCNIESWRWRDRRDFDLLTKWQRSATRMGESPNSIWRRSGRQLASVRRSKLRWRGCKQSRKSPSRRMQWIDSFLESACKSRVISS